MTKSFSEIQDQLDELPPLRLRGVLKKRSETLEEFLVKFFNKFNDERVTIYVGNSHEQTSTGKRRSLADIYKICKYYYPKVTLEMVQKALVKIMKDKSVPRFRSSYCHTINKRVWYVGDETKNSAVYDQTSPDEFGLKYNDWQKLNK